MTQDSSSRSVRLLLTIDGEPAARRPVHIDGGEPRTTDADGGLFVSLGTGRHVASVRDESPAIEAPFVIAAGVSELVIRLRRDAGPLDDPRLLAAMPSDRYRPLGLLGRGAVGSVYRCRDMTLQRDVAIKLLDQAFTSSEDEREAFLSEGRALAAIEHPNLIAIHDLGFHNDRGYMVVQYVDGPDLDRYLQNHGRLEIGALAAVGVQLARGLEALHRHGLLHRDVKPSNGIVDRNGLVRLADFGLVRPIADFTDPRSQVYGTPAYMSPEQLQALPLGPASDVYGLGATLYHLATGSLPYDGVNVIVNHVTAPPPDLREALPNAPEVLVELLRWMLAKSPDARPGAGEVAGALAPLAARIDPGHASPYQPRLDSAGATPASSSGKVAATLASTPASQPVAPTADPPSVQPAQREPATLDSASIAPSRGRRWVGPAAALLLLLSGVAIALATRGPGEEPSPPASAAAAPTEEPPPVAEPDAATGGSAEAVIAVAPRGAARGASVLDRARRIATAHGTPSPEANEQDGAAVADTLDDPAREREAEVAPPTSGARARTERSRPAAEREPPPTTASAPAPLPDSAEAIDEPDAPPPPADDDTTPPIAEAPPPVVAPTPEPAPAPEGSGATESASAPAPTAAPTETNDAPTLEGTSPEPSEATAAPAAPAAGVAVEDEGGEDEEEAPARREAPTPPLGF